MSDLEQHDRRLVLTRRSSPWLRGLAAVGGAAVVYACALFLVDTDLRDIRGNVAERLAGVFVAMAAVVGASASIWAVFAPDRTLTVDGVRRIVETVERRPFRRSRKVTRPFSAVASVDVVPEPGDRADTVHLRLTIRGEDRPLVVREFLARPEAEAIAARLRDLLRP